MYKYELHSHTSESSICAIASAKEIVNRYFNMGYSGLLITDHFLNSNTTVPKELEWKKRIDLFMRGYENALKEGNRIGIDVFFGWEYTFAGSDFITLGLDRMWLYSHPECMDVPLGTYCDLVHASGGYIIHAHPFRKPRHNDDMICLLPGKVDAVESLNTGDNDFMNFQAEHYADSYLLPKTFGSDYHGRKKRMTYIKTEEKIKNEAHLITVLKSGKYSNHVEPLD